MEKDMLYCTKFLVEVTAEYHVAFRSISQTLPLVPTWEGLLHLCNITPCDSFSSILEEGNTTVV
jgi:hypothetical protein